MISAPSEPSSVSSVNIHRDVTQFRKLSNSVDVSFNVTFLCGLSAVGLLTEVGSKVWKRVRLDDGNNFELWIIS